MALGGFHGDPSRHALEVDGRLEKQPVGEEKLILKGGMANLFAIPAPSFLPTLISSLLFAKRKTGLRTPVPLPAAPALPSSLLHPVALIK